MGAGRGSLNISYGVSRAGAEGVIYRNVAGVGGSIIKHQAVIIAVDLIGRKDIIVGGENADAPTGVSINVVTRERVVR